MSRLWGHLARIAVIAAAVLMVPGTAQAALDPAPTFAQGGFTVTTLIDRYSRMNQPTAIAFAPDGRLFIADDRTFDGTKGGALLVVTPAELAKPVSDRDTRVVLDLCSQRTPQTTPPDQGNTCTGTSRISEAQDRGFVGLAVDDVDGNPGGNVYVYLAYTYEWDDASPATDVKTQRLTRIEVEPDNDVVTPAPGPNVDGKEVVLLGTYAPPGGVMGEPYDHDPGAYDDGGRSCPPAPDGNAIDCLPADKLEHTIDSVRVGEDGELWVSLGDGLSGGDDIAVDASRAMDPDVLAGKLLRITRDGAGFLDNPFCVPGDGVDTTRCKVWATGLRNPFRFSLRPHLGEAIDHLPLVGDVGWNSAEEFSVVRGGRNYGWPCFEGSIRTPLWQDTPFCTAFYTAGSPAYAPPVFDYGYGVGDGGRGAIIGGPTYAPPAGAPSPYVGGAWNGDVFNGDYVRGTVTRVQLTGDGEREAGPVAFASDLFAVDWATDPVTGDLVFVDVCFRLIGGVPGGCNGTTQSPGVYRISYAPGNLPPKATARGTSAAVPEPSKVVHGAAPLEVTLSAAGTTDPESDTSALVCTWAFGDGSPGSAPDPGCDTPVQHTYADGGENLTAVLTVEDPQGNTDQDTVEVSPGNAPPSVSFTAGATSYTAGTPASATVTVGDPDAGDDPTTSFAVSLIHVNHAHEAGGASFSDEGRTITWPTATDHDADSYYVVRATATDERGLRTTVTREVHPLTAPLSVTSQPAGATFTYGGQQRTVLGPEAAIGFQTTLAAPETHVVNGEAWLFDGWSDGGPRSRALTIPAGGVSLVARYRDPTPDPGPEPVPPAPPAPAPPAPPVAGPPPLPAAAGATLITRRLTLKRGRRSATVVISCPRAASAECRGSVRLRAGRRTVGQARYRVAAGRRVRVTVPLTATGRRSLARAGRLSVTASLAPARAGATARTASFPLASPAPPPLALCRLGRPAPAGA